MVLILREILWGEIPIFHPCFSCFDFLNFRHKLTVSQFVRGRRPVTNAKLSNLAFLLMFKKSVLVLSVASSAVVASAQAVDYTTVLNDNLTTIDTVWGKVATIMIAVALVTVAVRFFRKAR